MKTSAKLLQQAKATVEKTSALPLPPLATVQELVKLYRVNASKHLSQNFLYHPSVVNRFVAAAGKRLTGCHVCEVGPGPGSITRSILQRGPDSITVVEKDARFFPMLKYIGDVADGRLKIVHGDILKFDLLEAFPQNLARAWHEDSAPFFIMGNLPFNISLPLLFKLLDNISQKNGVYNLGRIPIIVTLQKEVAERMCAQPMEPQRSRLSITTQYLCDIKELFTINRDSFVPAPKVEVSVVKIVPKKEFDIKLPFYDVDHVVKHAMHFRQKKCFYGIASLFPPKRDDLVRKVFEISGLDQNMKPWHLSMEHYNDLCNAFEEIAQNIPQLKLVDTYQPKLWLKHFHENGEPRTGDKQIEEVVDNQNVDINTGFD